MNEPEIVRLSSDLTEREVQLAELAKRGPFVLQPMPFNLLADDDGVRARQCDALVEAGLVSDEQAERLKAEKPKRSVANEWLVVRESKR